MAKDGSTTSETDSTRLLELCRIFDAAASAESKAPPPRDVQESFDRLRALIDSLPQRQAIKEEHIAKWLERTKTMASDRMVIEHGEARIEDIHAHMLWHVRRASGIGGSEAGTVLKHYRGKRGTFGDAHNLVLEKLLILSPKPGTPEMSRGVRAEPWIQRMFLEQTGGISDDSGLAKLKGFRWDKRPTSIGTPDDLIIMPDGRRRLIDYKAPSADVVSDYEANGISFDYVCQVHHYAVISMAAKVTFDDMSMQVFDPRHFVIREFPVPFDKDLAREIVHSCHDLWMDHVMTGIAPEAPKPDDLDVEDEAVIALGVQAAMLKTVEDDVSKRRKELLSRISMIASDWHDLATGKMDLSVAAFSRTRKYDADALTAIATAAGVEIAPFEKIGKDVDQGRAAEILKDIHAAHVAGADIQGLIEDLRHEGLPLKRKLDAVALADHLEELGVSTLTAAGVDERFTLTARRSGPEFDRLVILKDHSSELVDEIEAVIVEVAPQIILGQEPVVEMDDPQ
jgi:predicted phage-related endonuclease